jgi:predicted transcriptional regulator
MAISNELSSDIAIAILEKNKSPQELKQLKEIILQVHSELQKMSEAMQADRLKRTQPGKGRKMANGM